MNQDSFFLEYKPTRLDKIRQKLFPSQYVEYPELADCKDYLSCDIKIHFSMVDRIKILITGKIRVTAKFATENRVGNHATATGVLVCPPKWLEK